MKFIESVLSAAKATPSSANEAVTDPAQLDDGIDMARPEPTSLIDGLDPWLHPTKGWRRLARPRGTNKRRVLSAEGRIALGL